MNVHNNYMKRYEKKVRKCTKSRAAFHTSRCRDQVMSSCLAPPSCGGGQLNAAAPRMRGSGDPELYAECGARSPPQKSPCSPLGEVRPGQDLRCALLESVPLQLFGNANQRTTVGQQSKRIQGFACCLVQMKSQSISTRLSGIR